MNKKKQAGFTLLEMLVSAGIIAVLSGIVIFNVGLQRQESALLRSAQLLSTNLRRAQSFALSAKNFKATGVPCGWGIHWGGINSTNYIIFADLAASPDCSDRDYIRAVDGSEDFETINMEAGIYFESLSGNLSDVVFTPPDPMVTFTPLQTIATVRLANRNLNTKLITINRVGLISTQ